MQHHPTPNIQNGARFSKEVRALMGSANSLAVARGDSTIDTGHVLAAIARHPKGDALLAGKSQIILGDLLGFSEIGSAGMRAAGRTLPTQEDFKQLVRALADSALAAPADSESRTIELADVVRMLTTMPTAAALKVLRKYHLTPGSGPAAG